jgi:hypothetical protein
MKRLSVLLLAALVVGVVLYAQAGVEPGQTLSAQVVGLQVAARVPSDDMMMQPFNSSGGVALSVLVRSTAKTIVAFDDDASALNVLQDERGTNLLVEAPNSFQPPFGFPQIGTDGKAALFELRGNGVPSEGSTRIRAQGTAVLKVGTVQESARQVNVPLKKGTKITAGPVPFTIKDVTDGGSFGSEMTVTLAADQRLDAISEIRFEDASGTPIETEGAGMFTTTMMGRVSVEKQIGFAKKTDSATMVVTYWKGLETVRVPLKLDVGLSLK